VEHDPSMQALVRRPGLRLAEGIVTHIERTPVDVARAHGQWEEYVSAFAAAGWEIVEVARADDCPDAVFVEDAVVVHGPTAVMTQPGAPIRRPELPAVEDAVSALGLAVERIRAPATLDGGDVLQVGSTIYAGRSGRTNAYGIAQLAAILEPLGAAVVAVPVTKVLHLKSAVTALPDGTVIGYAPVVDDPSVFPRFLPMPEESGAHVVVLDEHRVLMAADCPRSAEAIRHRGFEPVLVDIGEFEKLEGCVTCLSVRVRTALPGAT
jgi:dimethylargininase